MNLFLTYPTMTQTLAQDVNLNARELLAVPTSRKARRAGSRAPRKRPAPACKSCCSACPRVLCQE